MTEHQLSVVIKANADISSLDPFREALNDIASKVEDINSKLGALASGLSGNSSLSELLTSIKGTGTIDLNVNVSGQTGGTGGTGEASGSVSAEAEVTRLVPKDGLSLPGITAEIIDIEGKDGLSLPGVTAGIIDLEWKGSTKNPRLEEVVGVIGSVTFGQGGNDDSARKQLEGVVGHIKKLKWEKDIDPGTQPIDVVGNIVDAKLTSTKAKEIAGRLSKIKLEINPNLDVRTEDEKGKLIDFGKKVEDSLVAAVKGASRAQITLSKEDFEKMLSPLQSAMDEYVETTMRHVKVYAQPVVLKKDLAKFVSDTNADLKNGKSDYVIKFLSKPVVSSDKIDDAYEKIQAKISSKKDFLVIPAYLGVQDILYFIGGRLAEGGLDEFLKSHRIVIPAVIRPALEEVDSFSTNVANDMSPEGHANGKVVTVGEGNADEMIVHRDLLEKGPAYLDKAFASLVRRKEGGRNVYLPDYDNTAIIPVDRYMEFKSRIYGGKFADGKGDVKVGGYTEYTSALWALSNSMPAVLSRLERMGEYTSKGEIDALIGMMSPALDRINANTDELEALVGRYGNDLSSMPQAVREAVLQATSNRDNYSKVMEFFQQKMTQADRTDGALNEFLKGLGDTSKETNKKLEKIEKILDQIADEVEVDSSSGAAGAGSSSTTYTTRWQQFKGWAGSDEGKARIKDIAIKAEEKALNTGANITETLLRKSLGLIQDIYNKMKEASPLLQAVSTLFNLAMKLFFMPLGNKLAEVLIPKTVELVEKVTDMWDMFEEEDSLGSMFTKAIDYGFNVFGEYFLNIGDRLQEQGGILSSVGHLLSAIGVFIETNGKSLIQFLLWMVGTIVEHFREVIATIIAFKVASITLSLAQLAATMAPDPFGLGIGKTLALPIILGLLAGGLATGALYAAIPGRAEGGYVPATPGGQPTLLAEGGEGEFVIPASKMMSVLTGGLGPLMEVMGGKTVKGVYSGDGEGAYGIAGSGLPSGSIYYNNISSPERTTKSVASGGNSISANFYINGYTDSQLKDIIRETVDDMVNDSRLKGRNW